MNYQTQEKTFNLKVKELVNIHFPRAKTYKTENGTHYIKNDFKQTIAKVYLVDGVGMKIESN